MQRESVGGGPRRQLSGARYHRYRCSLPGLAGFTADRRGETDASRHSWHSGGIRAAIERRAILAPKRSAPPSVGRHALVGDPQVRRAACRSARRRRSACRRADTSSRRSAASAAAGARRAARRSPTRAVLVERAVVAERAEIQLQRLALDQPAARHVVDDEVREVRLAGDRAQRSELGRREAREVQLVGMRIRHALEHRLARATAGPATRWPSRSEALLFALRHGS